MKTVRRNAPNDFSVSLKIRLLDKSIKSTVNLARQLESLNVTFITVHGRTPSEKASADFPVDVQSIAEIKKSISIPLCFNGDVKSLEDADNYYDATKCDGFMSARSILSNPALFSGHVKTPRSCIQDWLDISYHQNEEEMTYQTFHHHLVFMLEHMLKKSDYVELNNIHEKRSGVYDFFKEKFSMEPRDVNFPKNIQCHYDDTKYKDLINDENFWTTQYSSETSKGKFFLSKMYKIGKTNSTPDDYLDMMDKANELLFQ